MKGGTILLEKKQTRRVTHLLGLFLLLLAVAVGPATAQDGEPPPRYQERGAPGREPEIVEGREGTGAAIIALPAAADTYLASGRPNDNFGQDALFLGYNYTGGGDGFGAERILIEFDVQSALPDNAVINSASLRLHLNFVSPGGDDPMGAIVHRVTTDWSELGATWNGMPGYDNDVVYDTTYVGTTLTWYEWDVTDLVADWYDGTFPNHGVIFIGDEHVQQRERSFYSREATSDDPELVIDYTVVDDDQPPDVTVDSLTTYVPRSFTVSWSGADQGGAGIDYYDVRYRVDGGPWTDWRMGVTYTSAEFIGQDGRFYEFEARGVDNVGNVEPFTGNPEAWTTADTRPPTSSVNLFPNSPISSTTFTVAWSGDDGGGSGIAYYDVQYRYNNGGWVLWQDQTTATSAIFDASATGDGGYYFEVRAVDNLGRVEAFLDQPEASIIVDTQPPFVVPRQWMPLIWR